MFGLFSQQGSSSPEFVPPQDSRDWLVDVMQDIVNVLPHAATSGKWFHPPQQPIVGLDPLFDLFCAVQAEIGQGEVDLTLVEADDSTRSLPAGFRPLSDGAGLLFQTLTNDEKFVVLYSPLIFRKQPILLAHAAREIGRISLYLAQKLQPTHRLWQELPEHAHSYSELAAILNGLGVWVVNGSYVFENKCCGVGCGINLSGLKAGLSLPEACFALGLEAARRGVSRREMGRHLDATQKAAFSASYRQLHQANNRALALAPANAAVIRL